MPDLLLLHTMLERGRKHKPAWNACPAPLRLAGKPCAGKNKAGCWHDEAFQAA